MLSAEVRSGRLRGDSTATAKVPRARAAAHCFVPHPKRLPTRKESRARARLTSGVLLSVCAEPYPGALFTPKCPNLSRPDRAHRYYYYLKFSIPDGHRLAIGLCTGLLPGSPRLLCGRCACAGILATPPPTVFATAGRPSTSAAAHRMLIGASVPALLAAREVETVRCRRPSTQHSHTPSRPRTDAPGSRPPSLAHGR